MESGGLVSVIFTPQVSQRWPSQSFANGEGKGSHSLTRGCLLSDITVHTVSEETP